MKRFWLAILLLSVVAVGYADSSAVASLQEMVKHH